MEIGQLSKGFGRMVRRKDRKLKEREGNQKELISGEKDKEGR